MAVTLTVIEAAADRRLGDGVTAPAEPINGVLTRLLATATAVVEDFAQNAPESVQNTATSLILGYLYDAPLGDSTRFANCLANSGAQLLLSRYQSRRVAIVGDDGAAVAVVAMPTTSGLDSTQVRTLVAQLVASWALQTSGLDLDTEQTNHAANPNAHHIPTTGGGGGAVSESARLPVGTVVLRLGWSQSQVVSDDIFTRADDHPIDGAAVGTVSGLNPPVFPPALNTDPDLYLFIWIASAAANIADITFAGGTLLTSGEPLAAYEYAGTAGTVWVSNQRLLPGTSAYPISAVVGGDLIASQPWVQQQITDNQPTAPGVQLGLNDNMGGTSGNWRQTNIALPDADFNIELAYSNVWQMQQRINRARLAGFGAVTVGQSSGSYIQLADVNNVNFYISRTATTIVVANSPGNSAMGVRITTA